MTLISVQGMVGGGGCDDGNALKLTMYPQYLTNPPACHAQQTCEQAPSLEQASGQTNLGPASTA